MSDKTGDIKENLDSKLKKKEENKSIKSTQKNENDNRYQNNNTSLAIRHHMQLFSTICNETDGNKMSLTTLDSIAGCHSMENNYSQPSSTIFLSSSDVGATNPEDVVLFNDNLDLSISSLHNEILTRRESKSLSPENIENGPLSNKMCFVNHFNTVSSPSVNITAQINDNEELLFKNNSISSQNRKSITKMNSMNSMEYANTDTSLTMAEYTSINCYQSKKEDSFAKDVTQKCDISSCLSDRLSNSSEDGDTFSEDEENSSNSLLRLMYNRELSVTRIGMILSVLDSPQCIPPNVELNPNTGKALPQKKIRKLNHTEDDDVFKEMYHKNISLSGSFQHYHYPMKLGPNSQYSFSKNCKLNLDIPKTPEEEKEVFEVLIVDGRGVARERFSVIYAGLPFKTICLGPSESYNPFQTQAIKNETGEKYYIDSMDDSMFSGDVDISIDKNLNVNIKKACNCICRFRCPIYDSRVESEDYFYFLERSNVRIFNKERFDKILPGVLEHAKLNDWDISELKKYATITISFVDSREPDCKYISRVGIDKDSLPCHHKGSYMEITILPIIDILNENFKKFFSQSLCC